MTEQLFGPLDKDQMQGLVSRKTLKGREACANWLASPLHSPSPASQRGIREFLKVRTSYDVLPLSFRLIILDTDLLINKSLGILIQNGAVTPPATTAPEAPEDEWLCACRPTLTAWWG